MGFCPPCQIKPWAFVQWDIVQWAFVLVGFCPSGLLSVPRVLQTSCYHRAVSKENIFLLLLLVCLFLTSHQQLRSYGDPRLKAGNRSCDPRFTRQAVYPLHQSGSYILTTELSCPTESLVHDVECVTVLLFCSSRTAHESRNNLSNSMKPVVLYMYDLGPNWVR